MPKTVLAILAGGSSRRYQKQTAEWQDKILFSFNDEPFLVNLVRRSNLLYDETVVSVNSEARKEEYRTVLQNYNLLDKIDFIVDEQSNSFVGVMLGIGSTLRLLQGKAVQFLPSDRPFLMLSLLKSIKICGDGVSFFQSETGMIEPLLALYGSNIYFPKQFEELSLARADVLMRTSPMLKLYDSTEIIEMNNLPTNTFDNVNIQTELKIKTENIQESDNFVIPSPTTVIRSLKNMKSESLDELCPYDFIEKLNDLNHNYSAFLWSRYFKKSSKLEEEEYILLAVKSLKAERLFWKDNNMHFFALHALQDLLYYFPEEAKDSAFDEVKELRKKLKIESRPLN